MYLTNLYPVPNVCRQNHNDRFFFGNKVTLMVSFHLTNENIQTLSSLWKQFCFTASEMEILYRPFDEYAMYIGDPRECTNHHPVYYRIHSDAKGVKICGISPKSVMDGFTSMVQLIIPVSLEMGNEKLYIPATDIIDQPSIPFRAIHICIFPESEMSMIEKAISLAGFLKMTHVVIEFWGMLKYDASEALAWKSALSKKDVKPLVDLCHSYNMEVIPMVNHFGHASQSRSINGRHTVLNQNPRLQMYFEPDGWTWCLSNPDTYKLLGQMRSELMELCGEGSYFHIGFDEAYSFATCEKCRKRIPEELFAEYVNRIATDLLACGRRPIMWHDELIRKDDFALLTEDHVVANGQNHHTYPAIDLIDKRIIIADWQYSYYGNRNPTTEYFMQKGFDTVLCPWDDTKNVTALCKHARELKAYGIMLTTWHHLPSYIPKLFSMVNDIWSEDGEQKITHSQYLTEISSLVRKVYVSNSYETSGWNKAEVNEMIQD